MMKVRWVLVVLALFVGCGKLAAEKPTLFADKSEVNPGETLTVQFTTPGNYEAKAWVGIIPSEVAHGSEATNDQHDVTYQYLEKRTQGTLTFKAPEKPGSYDFRMNDSDANGKEVASVTFRVKAPTAAAGQLSLDKTEYKPGETVLAKFNAGTGFQKNAWVGIIPSGIVHGSEATNDQHDLAYQYLEGRAEGTLSFKAPEKAGSYDMRMHDTDSDGKEVASVTFSVK